MINYEINDTKYITIVGNIQSGKTNELINYCYTSVNYHKIPVIFILRNIRADLLQLLNRFNEHNTLNKSILEVKSLYQFKTNESIVSFLKSTGILILLCNTYHLSKMISSLKGYQGKYNLCIDEVDFSIKSLDNKSTTDSKMKKLKDNANHILGATATPFALFSAEKSLSKIKRMENNSNYHGIESLNVNFVDPIIIKNKNRFPYCDFLTINKIYSKCLAKDSCILLHSVIKERVFHKSLLNYLSIKWPMFTIIVYNGDGIFVKCVNRNSIKPLAKAKSYNQFKQYILKYVQFDDIHYFSNYGLSEVLQILKEDTEYSHTHISIISGQLASRGISFVSSDYSMHLTDQYFHPSKSSHGENLLQSLRILGCYKDSSNLTLWCSKETWNDIVDQYSIISKLVLNCKDSPDWAKRLADINIKRPIRAFTRPKLSSNISWKTIMDSGEYNLGIRYYTESNTESDSGE